MLDYHSITLNFYCYNNKLIMYEVKLINFHFYGMAAIRFCKLQSFNFE